MKTFFILACITATTLLTSCTAIDENLVENTVNRNIDFKQIDNLSQRSFLIAIDSINQSYIKPETRISMKDIKDIDQDKHYNIINDSIKLIFCENNPKTAEDSIGLMHNKILNETKLLNNNYNIGDSIDYNQILADVISSASKFGVSYDESDHLDKVKLFAFCDNINKILFKSIDEKNSKEIAYNEIETSLENILGKDKGKFITVLCKSIFSCLGQDIDLETLLTYSKNIDSILKESKLSEDDMKDCKKLLQTMVSSYTYWKSYIEANNLK